jgi:molybdopterin-guanine dinucleotide biosynthesis protein A
VAPPRFASVVGGILVGGASRRMGTAKALLTYGGVTFFERVARALAPHVERIVVLGDGATPASAAHLERLPDVADASGPLAGVLAALASRSDRAWLIVACDLPLFRAAAAAWLLDQRAADRRAILPRVGGTHVEPLGALYEPAVVDSLRRLAASGSQSLQPLADTPGVVTPTPPPALAEAWRNVNTPDELAALAR